MKKQFIFVMIEGVLFFLFGFFHFTFPCVFKTIFHIPCPGCGMTRAFLKILHFQFLESFQYNILSLPLFFLICMINILIVIDFIYHRNYFSKMIHRIENNWFLLLFLVVLSELVNLYRGI